MTMLSDKSEQVGAGAAVGMNSGGMGDTGRVATIEVTEIPVSSADMGGCGCGPGGVMGNTKSALSEVAPAVKADAQELKFQTEDYVIEHPLKAIGIAAGVGFVLGVLWSRPRSRRC